MYCSGIIDFCNPCQEARLTMLEPHAEEEEEEEEEDEVDVNSVGEGEKANLSGGLKFDF